MIANVYRASDSISTRPRISANWIPGRAAGLRASDSVAEATALPWASPQTAEAIAMENPAVMATQLVSAVPPPCAKAGMAKQRAERAMKIRLSVRMVLLLLSICRQEVVDAVPCRRPHA